MSGNQKQWIGYGSSERTRVLFDQSTNAISRSPFFRFDPSYSTIPSHSLPPTYRHLMGNLQLEDVKLAAVPITSLPFEATQMHSFTVPLPHESCPLNCKITDDFEYQLPILAKLHKRHPWKTIIPSHLQRNAWIVAVHDDQPSQMITTSNAYVYCEMIQKLKLLA